MASRLSVVLMLILLLGAARCPRNRPQQIQGSRSTPSTPRGVRPTLGGYSSSLRTTSHMFPETRRAALYRKLGNTGELTPEEWAQLSQLQNPFRIPRPQVTQFPTASLRGPHWIHAEVRPRPLSETDIGLVDQYGVPYPASPANARARRLAAGYAAELARQVGAASPRRANPTSGFSGYTADVRRELFRKVFGHSSEGSSRWSFDVGTGMLKVVVRKSGKTDQVTATVPVYIIVGAAIWYVRSEYTSPNDSLRITIDSASQPRRSPSPVWIKRRW